MLSLRASSGLIAAALLAAACGNASGQVGTAFTYQGRLANAGQGVDGPHEMEFRLMDAAAGGAQVGATLGATVNVAAGLFSVTLDFGGGAFTGPPRWLDVAVDGVPLLQRQPVTSAPQAVLARTAEQLELPYVGVGSFSGALFTSANSSTGGVGLFGYTTSNDANAWGVRGGSVSGQQGWLGGSLYGVRGEINAAGTAAVRGGNTAANTYGELGQQDNGVYGYGAIGVYGKGWQGGVIGDTIYGTAVTAQSIHGTGLAVLSAYGTAINCSGNFLLNWGTFEAHPTSTIWSTNKPATVKLNDGTKVKLFAEEAADIWFNDYGQGRLAGGRTHVSLDPVFLQTVTVDAAHPMMVFVQANDECNGLAVTTRTATGFDVVELAHGASAARFTYRVSCKRRYYEDERLATQEQDEAFNTRMLQTAWPEVANVQRTLIVAPRGE